MNHHHGVIDGVFVNEHVKVTLSNGNVVKGAFYDQRCGGKRISPGGAKAAWVCPFCMGVPQHPKFRRKILDLPLPGKAPAKKAKLETLPRDQLLDRARVLTVDAHQKYVRVFNLQVSINRKAARERL